MKRKFRTLLLCLPLLLGSCLGVPMKPEEIEELMQLHQRPQITYSNPDEGESGDDTL